MNKQRFTRSIKINLSSISVFLFGHFFGFGPGAARTQYLAPDALLLTTFAQSLYHRHTHTHNTHWHSTPPSPQRSAFARSLAHAQQTLALAAASPTTFCFRSISGPRTTHTGSRRRQPHYILHSLYLWPTHNKHWRSPPAPLRSPFALSLAHAQQTLSLAASPTTLCLRSISGPRTTHTVVRRQPRYALPSLSHCIAGPPKLPLSLGTTAVKRTSKLVALRVPALQGFANLLHCSLLKATRPE